MKKGADDFPCRETRPAEVGMIRRRRGRHALRMILSVCTVALLLPIAAEASPRAERVDPADYAPVRGRDWKVSTPAEQGLDSAALARLYSSAAATETTHSVLVVRNGCLIAEAYFHGGAIDRKERLQSVTKSFTSALVGIALDKGFLSSVDQHMIEFFPELSPRVSDPRKKRITIRQMLQMRAGYPWEESTPKLLEMLYHGFRPSLLADVPLAYEPGTDFRYSNLTSHLLSVIVTRATGKDLLEFARETIFVPLNIPPGEWIRDWEGYRNGHADLYLTARDMAKFGLLYLHAGSYGGRQLVPAQWVQDSLQIYSENAWAYRVGRNFTDMGYGYQWWSARAGRHRFNFAWGHGGQQIAIVPEFDMVIVVTADPLFGEHGGGPWRLEKQNLNLVGDFVASLR